jgi:hypothetical protein
MSKVTRRVTDAILEALEEGVLSWEKVARECLSNMSESDVEDMNQTAEFVSFEVAEGFYRCDDGSGERDIEADSAREAAEEYARSCDYDTDDKTIFVTVAVKDSEGDSQSIKVVFDPDEPDCEDGYEHEWREDSRQGNGGGVIVVDECCWCGARRTTDTWATDPDDGSQGHRTIRYDPARSDFLPRALVHYPFTTVRIGDGDRVRLAWINYTIEGDEFEPCGWIAVRNHDGERDPLTSIGTYVSWSRAVIQGPEQEGE